VSGSYGREVCIIGAGRVGTAMALLLSARGYHLAAVFDPVGEAAAQAARLVDARPAQSASDAVSAADIVLLTTPDHAILEACEAAVSGDATVSGKVFVHMSGALGLAVLAPAADAGAATVAVHPLQTFPDTEGAVRALPGSSFGVTCVPEMDEWSSGFVADLDGKALTVREGDKPLYHAGAVVASNLLVMIEYAACEIFGMLGLERGEALASLMPLVHATVNNIGRLGPEEALTGPLARGDVETLEVNLEALSADPELERLYRAVSLWGLRLVERRGEPDAGTIEKMRELLGKELTPEDR